MTNLARDKDWRLALIMALGFFLLYLNTLASHHSEAEDVLSYAWAIAKSGPGGLFHPNHLLFEPACWLFFKLTSLFYPGIEVLTAMQILQVLCGVAALVILFRLLLSANIDRALAVMAVLAMGFCYGFWAYSVEGDTYIMPLPLVFLALRELIMLDQHQWRYASFVRMALYLTLAILFYQEYVLVVPAFLLALLLLWWIKGKPEFKRIITGCLILGGLSGTLTLGVYLAVVIWAKDVVSVADAISWTLGQGAKAPLRAMEWTSLLKSAVGFCKAIWGTNFLFGFDWFGALAATLFPDLGGHEERYMALHLPTWILWLCLLMALASGVAFVCLLVVAIVEIRKQGKAFFLKPVVIPILAALVFMGAFNTVFYPENLEFWIGVVPLVLLLLFLALNSVWQGAKVVKGLALTFVSGLAITNGLGALIPQSTQAGDFWRDVNRYLIQQAGPSDLVLVRCGYVCNNYLRYYSNADVLPIYSVSEEVLQARIKAHKGRVLVSSFVFEPLPGYQPAGANLSAREQNAIAARLRQDLGKLTLLDQTLDHRIYRLDK